MPKHAVDPVFRELVGAINESGRAAVPVMLTVHGVVLRGSLISEARYFTELAERTPLMSALQPAAGLLGKDYAKGVDAESGYYLHLRGARLAPEGGEEGLWRIAVVAVDAWSLPVADGSVDGSVDGLAIGSATDPIDGPVGGSASGSHARAEKGPFARLVGG